MRHRLALLAAVLVLATATLSAQPRPGIAVGNTVLIAGYNCAADQLARADAIIGEATAPVLNKYVASGKILNWGYLGAVIGTPTNRHIYLWASDPVALMQARSSYLPEIQGQPRFAEFSKICGSATISLSNLLAVSAPPK